jgi:hypothetical protein
MTRLNDDSVDPIKRMMPEKYHTYGRQYLIGLTYKM